MMLILARPRATRGSGAREAASTGAVWFLQFRLIKGWDMLVVASRGRRVSIRRFVLITVACLAFVTRGAAAQDVTAAGTAPPEAAPQDPPPGDKKQSDAKPPRSFVPALLHNLGDDVKHLPRRNSLYFALGGGAAAAAVHPFDQSVNQHLLGSSFADGFFIPGKYIGSTQVQIGASVATYIVGRASNKPRVRHIGMDLLEAQLLSEGLVQGIKVAVRRHRPINPDGSSAPGFSFPSGHAAITFASATVLQQHFGMKAAVPTYLIATYVALSRLHDNRHFLSDVVFGATTGIIVGRSVTWHGRNSYNVAMIPQPGGLGVLITW